MRAHPSLSVLQRASEKARLIELRARRAVQEQLSGGYRSVFRGRGMDFDEVREYVPGDDVRSIDWSVTARAGRPFVKKFREERELTLILAVDVSASNDFGSDDHSKRERAAELACVLALAALRSRDKVGLLAFSDRVELFVPPAASREHVVSLVQELLTLQPRGRGTHTAGALEHLNRVLHRRAAVVLISDLKLHPPDDASALVRALGATARRHELLTLWTFDPHELTLPNVGKLTLEDAETGELVVLDTARLAVRNAYARIAQIQREHMRALLASAAVRSVEVSTSGDYLPTLAGLFGRRAS